MIELKHMLSCVSYLNFLSVNIFRTNSVSNVTFKTCSMAGDIRMLSIDIGSLARQSNRGREEEGKGNEW